MEYLFAGAAMLAIISAAVGGGVALTVDSHGAAGSDQALAAGSLAARSAASVPTASVEQVATKVVPSVVELQTSDGTAVETGSGVVLSADGLILTNNHVVAPINDPAGHGAVQTLVTLSDGRTAPGSVVGADPGNDIAVVRAQGLSGLTPISFGSSANLQVGQQVVAVGSPLGLNGTVTSGIISALNRTVAPSDDPSATVLHAVQTDAPLNPGNSGGALVDMSGQLVGINSAIASPGSAASQTGSTGLGFAIPADQVKRVADQLVAVDTASRVPEGTQADAAAGAAQGRR